MSDAAGRREAPDAPGGTVPAERPALSPLGIAMRRFRRNRLALVGLGMLLGVVGACAAGIVWDRLAVWAGRPEPYLHLRPGIHPQPPSLADPFGTDPLGRDVLARTLIGGCISLGVGLASAAISVFIGTFWGLVAGYTGRGVDTAMMRFVDVLYGLPYVLVVILLIVVVPDRAIGLGFLGPDAEIPSVWVRTAVLFAAIGGVSWLTMARVVRGQALSLRETPFVEAARAMGAGHARIVLHEVLPNLMGTILVCATLTVPLAILQESFLSFLGLGVPPPMASWGTLASEAIEAFNPVRTYWWLLLFPCLFLAATLMGLNFVGDGLRDAFDPRSR